jgi:hypothetical protein
MDAESLAKKMSALGTILDLMEVPLMRRNLLETHNVRWLQRNLAVQNSEHPLFHTAFAMLKEILKEKQ